MYTFGEALKELEAVHPRSPEAHQPRPKVYLLVPQNQHREEVASLVSTLTGSELKTGGAAPSTQTSGAASSQYVSEKRK